MNTDPFRVLGLPARPDLTDDEVRAAWRRIAAATHPDRDDGGDPAWFAEAAAAYTELRTLSGRGEAYADLAAGRAGRRSTAAPAPQAAPPERETTGDTTAAAEVAPGRAIPAAAHWYARLATFLARIRRGRPALLALRAAIAAGISLGTVAVADFQPATPAIIVGMLTWLIRTGRYDLAPPPAHSPGRVR